MSLKEKYVKIAKEIEDSYFDKYLHFLSSEPQKHLFVDKAISILNILTEKDWKITKFNLISFFMGVQLNNSKKYILMEEEKEECIKNLYDLSYIRNENLLKFKGTVQILSNIFPEKGFLVMGNCELTGKNGETLTIPLIFDINQLFLNISVDKNRIKKIYQTLYEHALKRENQKIFPPESLPELFLNAKWKKNLNYYLEESAAKYISFIKEHKNIFTDKEGKFIIKNTYNYILSSNIEVIEGKNHLFFKMNNQQNNFFEYLNLDDILNKNILKYIQNKYQNKQITNKFEEIQTYLFQNKDNVKNKKIVLLNNKDFINGKNIMEGNIKLPGQEKIIKEKELDKKNFSNFSTFSYYNTVFKKRKTVKGLYYNRF